jgi:hypothetical protein
MSKRLDPVEGQIEEAMERGEFDRLPGAGQPLDTSDTGPGWWSRRFLTRMRASEAAAEVARQVDRELGELWALADAAAVEARVAVLNARLAEANRGLAPDQRVDLLMPAEIIATWSKMSRARKKPG